MMIRRILLLIAISLAHQAMYSQVAGRPAEKPTVVVLSLDGFRYDYASRTHTPCLDSLAAHGVKAEHFIPGFPTLTFPNHYSLATGLYPDHHGIVHNQFYDFQLDKTYSVGDRKAVEEPAFYGGEPIWITAAEQGIRTASYFWVGSEAAIAGRHPDIWHKYNQKIPFQQRADSVIAWLQLPEASRPRLIMWYFHEPDESGHDLGPENPAVLTEIQKLDQELGIFLKKLNQLPNAEFIHFILVSDHGMQQLDPENRVRFLEDFVKEEWLDRVTGYNPVMNLDCKVGFEDSVYQALKKGDHFQVFKNTEIPEYWHYGSNPRELEMTVVADSAWVFRSRKSSYDSRGAHGYDNRNPNMHGIFYATGKLFQHGKSIPELETVDLYGIICRLLEITPAKNDGHPEKFDTIFVR